MEILLQDRREHFCIISLHHLLAVLFQLHRNGCGRSHAAADGREVARRWDGAVMGKKLAASVRVKDEDGRQVAWANVLTHERETELLGKAL